MYLLRNTSLVKLVIEAIDKEGQLGRVGHIYCCFIPLEGLYHAVDVRCILRVVRHETLVCLQAGLKFQNAEIEELDPLA